MDDHVIMTTLDVKEVKLVLLGDSGVGKSSIVQRYCDNAFSATTQPTIGAAYQTKDVKMDHFTIRYKIWDTAGQEKFRAILPMYFRETAAAIVTYDISREATFANLQYWMQELKGQVHTDVIFAIAGNKCDLESSRQVSYQDAVSFAESHDAVFVETSAKTGINVPVLFFDISQRLAMKYSSVPESSMSASTVLLHPATEKEEKVKKRKCCH